MFVKSGDKLKTQEAGIVLPFLRLERENSNPTAAIAEEGLDILLFRNWLPPELAQAIFVRLLNGLVWHQVLYKKYGKRFKTPRYTTVFGQDDSFTEGHYKYPVSPIPDGLKNLLDAVQRLASSEFNFMLFNLYLDGNQAISYHSDDESFLGPDPTIASLSLGKARTFRLRKKCDHKIRREILLESGDLLVMRGRTQHDWEHAVPKSGRIANPRINVTFRKAINSAGTNNYYRYNRYGDDYKLFIYKAGEMVPFCET